MYDYYPGISMEVAYSIQEKDSRQQTTTTIVTDRQDRDSGFCTVVHAYNSSTIQSIHTYRQTDDRLGILLSTNARKVWPQQILCAAVSIMFVLQQRSGVNSVSIVYCSLV